MPHSPVAKAWFCSGKRQRTNTSRSKKLKLIQKIQDTLSARSRLRLPTCEKRAQRSLHLCERFRTKQNRLVMRRVVNVVRGGGKIERTQFRFVHLRQLTR